jgi:hypothetical protein
MARIGRPRKDENLFRFEVFCTDRQLGDALVALTGKVAQVTPPQLVANATHTGNGIAQRTPGRVQDLFLAYLRDNKMKEITPQQGKEFLRVNGFAPNTWNYVAKHMKRDKILKLAAGSSKTGHGVRWAVTLPASKAEA